MIGNESWLISIENSADFIKKNIGFGTVQAVFEKYGATGPDEENTGEPYGFSPFRKETRSI